MTLERVLVADNEPQLRQIVAMLFQDRGATVVGAATGEAALLALGRAGPFDVGIIDLLLPPPTGLRVISLLRKRGDRTPFVVITGAADDAVRATVAELGQAIVVAKPFTEEALLAAVARVCAGATGRHPA